MAKYVEKVYQFFTFSLYVRILLEANIFLLLSSFSELHNWLTRTASEIISLFIAFIGAWIWIMFVALSLISWYKVKNIENMDIYIPLKEFFNGTRSTSLSKLYSTFMLSRRVIFVALLTFGEKLISFWLICPMLIIQIVYLANLITVISFI